MAGTLSQPLSGTNVGTKSTGKPSNKRLIFLAILAALIAVTYLVVYFPNLLRGDFAGSANQPASASLVERRIQTLQSFEGREAEIRRAYQELEPAYIGASSTLKTLKISKAQSDKLFMRSLIEAGLSGFDTIDQAIAISEASQLRRGDSGRGATEVRRVFADISFTAFSHRDVLDFIETFGQPLEGTKWVDVTVIADRRQQRIELTGRLEAFIIDLPEGS